MSTSEGIFSTLEGSHDSCGEYHYPGPCFMWRMFRTSKRKDIMSSSWGYHKYTGGCSVHQRVS